MDPCESVIYVSSTPALTQPTNASTHAERILDESALDEQLHALAQLSGHQGQQEDGRDASSGTKRRRKCGECIGCQPIREDCGECVVCKNNPEFGGLRKRHQPCIYRECQMLKYTRGHISSAVVSKGPCGKCIGCLQQVDCGLFCEPCKRKKKFGEDSNICRYRECQRIKYSAMALQNIGAVGAVPNVSRASVENSKRMLDSDCTVTDASQSGLSHPEVVFTNLIYNSPVQTPEASVENVLHNKRLDAGDKTVDVSTTYGRGSQSLPMASTPKRKHPATGEGAPVQTTVHQRNHGVAEEQIKVLQRECPTTVERVLLATVHQRIQPVAEKSPVKGFQNTVSQSRPLVSILKKKHPTTGEGASAATKHQKMQPTAEESPVERAPVEQNHRSPCAIQEGNAETQENELDNQATLPEMLTFSDQSGETAGIAQRIGTKYKKFGIILLNDSDGRTVDTISTNEKGDAEDINIEILKRWVQGAGRQPATWRTLVQVLKLSGLCALAKEIEDMKCHHTCVIKVEDYNVVRL